MDYKNHYDQLEKLISKCYEEYKNNFSGQEQEDIEIYLYQQGEYELALELLMGTLRTHDVKVEYNLQRNLNEAKEMMKLS